LKDRKKNTTPDYGKRGSSFYPMREGRRLSSGSKKGSAHLPGNGKPNLGGDRKEREENYISET